MIEGFTNQAVGEPKERIRGAFANSNIPLPRKRVTTNLVPVDIRMTHMVMALSRKM